MLLGLNNCFYIYDSDKKNKKVNFLMKNKMQGDWQCLLHFCYCAKFKIISTASNYL